MTPILVLYVTTDGHTAKIARALGETFRERGFDADVVDAGATQPRLEDYAAVVVAASVHAGGYQRSVRRWVRRYARALNDRPSAFVSVCLGVLQKEPAVEARLAAIMFDFLTDTGWCPGRTKAVAGALMYTRYNPLKRWVMKRIVRAAGGDTDASRDYEVHGLERPAGLCHGVYRRAQAADAGAAGAGGRLARRLTGRL